MAENSSELHYAGNLRVRVCGICLQQDKMLLIRHKPFAHSPAGLWSPPGGGLQFGEPVNTGLKREFYEETGLHVEVSKFLFVREFIAPPLHALELFFAVETIGGSLVTGSDPELPLENQLIAEVAFKTLPEIQQIPLNQLHQVLHHLPDFESLYQFSFASNLN